MRHYTEGEILQSLRERFTPRKGQSQTKIAAELGFSVQYIQAVLAGSRPLTERMAQVLGYHTIPKSYVKGERSAVQ